MNEHRINERRQIELDLLRIIALLAVISVHVSGMGTDNIPITDFNKKLIVLFDSVVTWQVPAYVMISGRFFLDPERTVDGKKLLKSIVRIVIAFIAWDILYQAYYIISGVYSNLNWKGILSQTLIGPYHFWFLYMIVFLYAITPFLRLIVKNKCLTEYFIILFFCFEFISHYGIYLPIVGSTVAEILTKTNFHFALGYSGYFVLGYYLNTYCLPKTMEKTVYVAAAACFVSVCAITQYVAIKGGDTEFFTRYLTPNVIIVASAIFYYFVKHIGKHRFSERAEKTIVRLSEYSFGIYLVHALVAELLAATGLTAVLITPIIMMPVLIFVTFVLSAIIVFIIRKTKFGRKIT